ncbi:serine/arginine repetitive matrix protein 1-like [Bombyx mori]|uniref:serine/arginine repetitive matrix protein 1-like n=1 Tax=Bombyx mori TaxID=7091 RepID=UPI002ED1AC22
MSGGNSPPLISTPGPSHKGRQVMPQSSRYQPTPAARIGSMGLGTDSLPGPSVAAQRTLRIEPEEGNLPSLTDPSGPSRPRKKARSESDRGSSSDKDKRPRLGPSSRSEGEDGSTTSSAHSSTESVTPSSSRSSSPSGSPIPAKPIPKPRAPARTGIALRQQRSPPRSPSPTLSPIPVDSTRGAPALSGTAGNLDSTRYMDLESTRPHVPKPNPIPSTSYAAMAARPGAPTTQRTSQSSQVPPPRPKGRAQEMPSKVAVRGLPADTDEAEIVNALKELGFPARYARCIRSQRGRPGCVFHVALDHLSKDGLARLRCAVYRKRARMMGVTVPPPAPQAPRAGSAALPASEPVAKWKGKGKGKSSQPPPPSHSAPSAVVVEASPSASTLMAQANPPRQTTKSKPTPAPRGRTTAAPLPQQTPCPTSGLTTTKNREKNRRKKLKKKARKKEEKARRGIPEPIVPDPPSRAHVETMEVSEASPPTQLSTTSPQLPSAHPAEGNLDNLNSQPPLPPRPQRERRSGRQASQPAGFAAWLLALWENLAEVISGVIREIASGASPIGAILSGFYQLIARLNG